jgi:hypothetical protein
MNRDNLDALCGCGAGAASRCDAALPDDPQCATNFHFGMLLGVDEFRTEQGFHVGHARRHQRLLHGAGVVAGFAVGFDDKAFELRVGPGHAVDVLGRDLALPRAQCVSLPRWWEEHRKDEVWDDLAGQTAPTLELELVAHYANCLDRAVPAIADPCAGTVPDIAYARVCETVRLELRRWKAPADPPAPSHHLLRVWLGLEPPVAGDDDWLLAAYSDTLALPAAEQPAARAALLLEVLARASAAESAEPPEALPDGSNLALPLARLHGVHLFPGSKGPAASVASVALGVRPVLLPVALLLPLLLAEPPALPAAAGPALQPGGAALSGQQITVRFNQPLEAGTATPQTLLASEFVAGTGWKPFTSTVSTDNGAGGGPTATLALDRAPAAASRLRLTVVGNGSAPLLGTNGLAAGAPHPAADGRLISIDIQRA